MKVVPLRLQPGDDLRLVLEAWMGAQQEQAGCVISAVGSLSLAQLRLAGATQATAIRGELEIVSLSGTLSPDGIHLHIAIANSSGAVIGGHLCAGSLVRTTARLPRRGFGISPDPFGSCQNGEGGIRTHGRFPFKRFRVVRFRPLSHLSRRSTQPAMRGRA